MRKCLELATFLTNEWSLISEICDDMEASRGHTRVLIQEARSFGIGIDLEEGKVRLSSDTSIDNVRMCIASRS